MVDFFKRRQAAHKRIEETSSKRDLQRIEDRRKHALKHIPPGYSSKAATVFVWGTFDAIYPRVVRRRVSRDAAEDVFLQHNDESRRFDPYFNEWDCWLGWSSSQSDLDALLEEQFPDNGTLISMRPVQLPSPISSRPLTPASAIDSPIATTTPDAPTSDPEPAHVTNTTQDDDGMDVGQESNATEHDHSAEMAAMSQDPSDNSMDADIAHPLVLATAVTTTADAAADDIEDNDMVSLYSNRSAEESAPPPPPDNGESVVDVGPRYVVDDFLIRCEINEPVRIESGHVANDSRLGGNDNRVNRDEDDVMGNPLVPADEALLEHLADAFRYRYGFCERDVSNFCFSSEARQYSRDTFDKVTQVYVHRYDVVPRHLHMPIIDFANILVANHRIENNIQMGDLVSLGGLWDLSVNSPNRLPLPSPHTENLLSSALRIRKVACATMGRYLYIVREASRTSEFAFSFVLEEATTALECYRRNWRNLLSMGKDLAQSGKAFRTYIPRDPQFTGPMRSRGCNPLGHRLRDYVFQLADYSAYEDARQEVFVQPFGRAAVLVGGVIWRLAVDTIGAEAALQGPTMHAHEFGDLVTDPAGKQFVDDALSEDEMDLLCGKYVIYTGQGIQTSFKWWWPPHSTWVKGSLFVGYWTPQCERWYQDRLQIIQAGKAQPLTRNEWKANLRRSHHTRPFVEAVEVAASNYFACKYYH